MKKFKSLILMPVVVLLLACGGGGSDSGGGIEPTAPGQNLPANFVGTYIGQLNFVAEALGLTESGSIAITITVMQNGTVRFDGDDADETFTVGITDAGEFAGELTVNEAVCQGTIGVSGSVDGTTASGTVQGEGECTDNGLTLDVDLSGDFNATK